MPETLSLPDLDALDPAALKAIILHQHAHTRVQQERLGSRGSEIGRLVLLVAKLNQMLFGRKSERMLRQIEQLEFQLEDLQVASAVEETQAEAAAERPAAAKPRRRPLPEHLPHEIHTHMPAMTPAPTAVADSASWAKMWPRCWSTCVPASRSCATCARS